MNIVLVNPRLRGWTPNVYVPLGLATIAAVLEQEGYTVNIVDLNTKGTNNKELQRRIADADIVGITGLIIDYGEILGLVNAVKQANRRAVVILGGGLATALSQKLLEVSPIDFVVIGEGERTAVDLVSAIKQGSGFSGIRGIAYREGDQIITTEPVELIKDLDVIPLPARHLLDMSRYVKNHFKSFFNIDTAEFGNVLSTNMVTSRGCPYHCTFCFKGMWGYEWRGRSPENIVSEIESLYEAYGINGFFFNDEIFALNKERVFAICRLVEQKRLKIAWYCNGRAGMMTKELLQAMYSAGCRGIAYGIESGNQQVLDSMRKKISLAQVRDTVKCTKGARIHASGYFIFGMLGETRTTMEDTLSFARELDLDYCGFTVATPLIGTELYDSALKAGKIPSEQTELRDMTTHVNANLTQDCTDRDLLAFASGAFKEFYIKKRFGKYYFLRPYFLREVTKLLVSVRNRKQAKELLFKGASLIKSYWHHGHSMKRGSS